MATTRHQTTSASHRRTVIPAFTNPRDRLAYLWLVLGIVLLLFATVSWIVPLLPGILFAGLSLAKLVVLIGVAIARRRKVGEAGAAEPITVSPAAASPSEAVPTLKKSSRTLFQRRPFRAQYTGSALFSVVFLVCLAWPMASRSST
jgi:hypothetical protein